MSQKLTNRELEIIANKRSSRGLTRGTQRSSVRRIEGFENIKSGGIIILVIVISLVLGIVGVRYPLRLLKNNKYNMLYNFIIHFFLGYIILPVRIILSIV
jgi:hypothetical protein